MFHSQDVYSTSVESYKKAHAMLKYYLPHKKAQAQCSQKQHSHVVVFSGKYLRVLNV